MRERERERERGMKAKRWDKRKKIRKKGFRVHTFFKWYCGFLKEKEKVKN